MVGQWHARRFIRRDSCPKSVGRFRTGFGFGKHARILRSAGCGISCAVRSSQVPPRLDRDGAMIQTLTLPHPECEVSYRAGSVTNPLHQAAKAWEISQAGRNTSPAAPITPWRGFQPWLIGSQWAAYGKGGCNPGDGVGKPFPCGRAWVSAYPFRGETPQRPQKSKSSAAFAVTGLEVEREAPGWPAHGD